MGWYLVVIVKLHIYECIIYIFTSKVQNHTPSIFNKSHYHCFYKEFSNNLSPVMIDTTHNNAHFENKIHGKIPRNGVIDPKKYS